MELKIRKGGHVTIPKKVIEEAGLKDGGYVRAWVTHDGTLVLKLADKLKLRFTWED